MARSPSRSNLFKTLSQDIWAQILDQISPSDKASVLATCRGLRLSSEGSLYRHVDIDWVRPPLRRVLMLFRVIYQRPELAAQIEHLSMVSSKMDYPGKDHHWDEEWVPPLFNGDWKDLSSHFQDEVKVAKDIVIRSQLPSSEVWIDALENGNPYAFAAIIISQLHNLRSLRLDYTFVWQSGFPGLIVRHALLSVSLETLSRFSNLSYVEYGLNVPPPRSYHDALNNFNPIDALPLCNPEQFAGWFYIPSLVSLQLWLQSLKGVGDRLSKLGGSSKLAHLANLKIFSLVESSITETEIRDILSHLSSVRSIHLGINYPSENDKGYFQDSSRPPLSKQEQGALFEGIMSIKDTVQNISIGLELCPLFWVTHVDERGHGSIQEGLIPFQGFLKEFPVLETAELPIVMLFGWDHKKAPQLADLVPSTLQKLCLRDNLEGVADYQWDMYETTRVQDLIKDFLPCAHSMAPHLKTISIRTLNAFPPEDLRQNYALPCRESCEKLGLDIEITQINDHLSPGLWTTR
ncbi:hypothetical protein N7478_002935 [Penicillium angulare]|uniref:uncharacterized protein n=1 Tax=Penicillium angulare TaxID=116970 RepID=UPI002541C313|nr:uncharacterized protein N7478_002935 [Penicillium angulare]KAJ5287249.1 hypothetical protein N7478_002935 [Penicillium angulare]